MMFNALTIYLKMGMRSFFCQKVKDGRGKVLQNVNVEQKV